MIPLSAYLVVGAVLFGLGLIGFLARRNLIVLFLCAELMLQGVALNFVAFAKFRGNLHGQAFTLIIITVAACEAGLALAFFLALHKRQKSLDVSVWQELREPGVEPVVDLDTLPAAAPETPLPHLPSAGRRPQELQPR